MSTNLTRERFGSPSTRPDPALALEFKSHLLGEGRSDALVRLLRELRAEPLAGKHVVVCTRPFREYRLARLTGRRGEPVQLVPDLVFPTRGAAEWAVFCRRWSRYFGVDLAPGIVDPAMPVTALGASGAAT